MLGGLASLLLIATSTHALAGPASPSDGGAAPTETAPSCPCDEWNWRCKAENAEVCPTSEPQSVEPSPTAVQDAIVAEERREIAANRRHDFKYSDESTELFRTSRALLVAGGCVLSGGLAYFGTSVAMTTLVLPSVRGVPGEDGVVAGYATLIAHSATIVITGAILLGAGVSKRREADRLASRPGLSIAPLALRRGGGFSLLARF